MNTVRKIGNWISLNLIYFVIGVTILAFFVPNTFVWASSRQMRLMQLVMLTMGLTMSLSDFGMVVKKPKYVLFVAVLQFAWMPFAGWLVCKVFNLPAEIALGVILVGCCPGGTASNICTYLAKGDTPLSITCTAVSTLLCPIVTPALMVLYAQTYIDIPFMSMVISILQIVFAPLALGFIINAIFRKYMGYVTPFLPIISTMAFMCALGGIISSNVQTMMTSGILVFLCCLLHNASGLAVGHVLCGLFKFPKPVQRACSIEVGMQNSGLAATMSMSLFTPATALAGAVFGIWHSLTGSIYASLCVKADERASKKASNQ